MAICRKVTNRRTGITDIAHGEKFPNRIIWTVRRLGVSDCPNCKPLANEIIQEYMKSN